MSKIIRNPFSGRNSSGTRFRFQVRSISRHNLYLPLKMKVLPEIKALLDGVSPLEVFKCDTLRSARETFYALRKRFDFPYWAALEFSIPYRENPLQLLPLRLNDFQYSVVNEIERRSSKESRDFLLISKTVPQCGLTTCVQAFILWRQIYAFQSDSVVYVPSVVDANTYKEGASQFLKQAPMSDAPYIPVSGSNSLYCSAFQDSDFSWKCKSKKTGFVHLADMSKWTDHSAKYTSRVLSETMNALSRDPSALFIMEGDFPSYSSFCIEEHPDLSVPQSIRLLRLNCFKSNPVFLDYLIQSSRQNDFLIEYIQL